MESTSHPGGSAADLQQAQPEQGLTALCPQVDCPLGEVLTQDLQGHGGQWPHSFLPLVCPVCSHLHPLPMQGYQDPPSTRNLLPQPRKETSIEGAWIHGEAGAPPHGVSGLGDLAHGEGAAQGRACSWSSGSSCPDAGPRLLFHKNRRSEDPFLGNNLSDVTWAS